MTGEAWPMSNVLILQELFTNEAFLRHLFGDAWREVQVCFVAGDPERAHRGAWTGYPAEQMLQMRGQELLNAYFSVGGSARSLPDFVDLRVIVLDDVGTKVDLGEAELLLGPPTWVLETSPGNHQAGWCIKPVTDRDRALGLVKGVYEALGGHGDNLKNVVGWMRLPIGSNGKTKYLAEHPGGFRHRMAVWNPSVKLDTSSWAVTPVGLGPGFGHAEMPDPGEVESDAILQAFRLLGRVQGLRRRTTMGWGYDVDCPWAGEHTDRVHEGAVYVPVLGRFCCHHGHCQDKGVGEVRVRLDELLKDAGLGVSVAALEFDDEVFEAEADEAEADEDDPAAFGAYPPTEYGAAQAFADRYRDLLRFDHSRGSWLRWQGGRWQPDACEYAFSLISDFAQAFGRAHPGLKGTGSTRYAAAVQRMARAHPSLSTDGTSWDLDPWRVGAPGCEINLETGEIEAPDPAHGITKQLLVAPKQMPTPVWDRFLWDMTGGDPDTITFLQAWCGYCLTGDTSEEKFAFLWGPGGNGKSTFVETITAILGDYATTAPADMFLRRKFDAHPEEVARLAGVRLVSASEIEDGRTFNIARLKSFTGRDRLIGRFMRQDSFMFLPQFKLMLNANNQPRLTETTTAIARRMIVLPCTHKPRFVDTTLRERLVAEQPGILMWMLQGEVRRRAAGGLSALIPAIATEATEEYLAEQDHLALWAAERCVFGDGREMNVTEAYEDYRMWLHQQGVYKDFSRVAFSRQFLERFKTCTRGRNEHARLFEGVSFSIQDVET